MQNVMRVYYDDKGNIKDLKHLKAIASSHNVDLIEIYCEFDTSFYNANISFTRPDGMTLGPYPLLPKTDENGKTYHTYLLESREIEIAGALQCTPRFEIYELDEEIGDYVVTYSKPCGMFTITVYDAVITTENDYQTYTQAEIDQMFRALSVKQGTIWHFGNEIEGIGENIESSIKANVNDFYFNNVTGYIYKCISFTDDKTIWNYISSIKDSMDYFLDNTDTTIECLLEDNKDMTYTADNISSMQIVIPNTVKHGFCAGVNFKSGDNPPSVNFVNNSNFELKIMVFGLSASSYTPSANRTIMMSIFCDGINVYCYINEVSW